MEARILLGLGLAALLVFVATPGAIRVAGYFEFFDKPAGYKDHARPTPYLGGAAVMAGFSLVALILAGDLVRSLPVLCGAVVLWVVGTVDDRRYVSPLLRAAIELALAAGVWALGAGWDLGHGQMIDFVVTCLWILGVVNAVNLFDNMDGASSTMAVVISGAVAVLGLITGDAWLAATAAALCGACLGFLPYNIAQPNARIFLGDGGSMPIGFALATLVMIGSGDALPGLQGLLIGVLLIGVLALDTSVVIVSRLRKGISILTGGRDHLTHRTRRRMPTARAVAGTLGAVQALLAAVGLLSVEAGSNIRWLVAAISVAAGVAIIAFLEAEEDRLCAAAAAPSEEAIPGEVVPRAVKHHARFVRSDESMVPPATPYHDRNARVQR